MATDAIDMHALQADGSPDAGAWPATLAITRIRCTAAGGFELTFDRAVPESWKWPSNPAVPSENYQWTFWIVRKLLGLWVGAGLVQYWQGREQGTRGLPPLFASVDGAPGWTRLWGEGNKWPLMGGAPTDDEPIGIFVTAGNARKVRDVTSVAERSNLVLFTVHGDDSGDQTYSVDPSPIVVDPPPVVDPPAPATTVQAQLDAMRQQLTMFNGTISALTDALVALRIPPLYGTIDLPKWLSSGAVVLTTTPPPKKATP